MRWFQKLIAYRMLEHDRLGQLVWEQIIVSMARQVGKSYLLRLLALWRMHSRGICSAGIRSWCCTPRQHVAGGAGGDRPGAAVGAGAGRPVYKVRFANGELEIRQVLDGSRWIVRANRSPGRLLGGVGDLR